MSVKCVTRCDHCGREVTSFNKAKVLVSVHNGEFDFCGKACLEEWALTNYGNYYDPSTKRSIPYTGPQPTQSSAPSPQS
jgi:hypothetical protein